jgi:hypothetical protein
MDDVHVISCSSWPIGDGTWGASVSCSRNTDGSHWVLGQATTNTKVSAEALAETRARAALKTATVRV